MGWIIMIAPFKPNTKNLIVSYWNTVGILWCARRFSTRATAVHTLYKWSPSFPETCKIWHFTDEMSIIIRGKDIDTLKDAGVSAINSLSIWLDANKWIWKLNINDNNWLTRSIVTFPVEMYSLHRTTKKLFFLSVVCNMSMLVYYS